ncbi:MAG: hypothetical protein MZW92_80315 [Comamonadaceae bacterium]|nr:hypothetical protein [Comamonadaceae bacterium]
MGHEWVMLVNLLGLLLGFALLSRHFEESHVPEALPRYLPDDWKGGFVLLAMIFVLSSFLDNIAAALIGGTIARIVFRHKVHIGYLAAIVAASNAGGSGSVVGDTTTTMMWIDGVESARRAARLCRRRRRAGDLRHPGGAAAAQAFAHRQGRAGGHPYRLGAGRHRGRDPDRGHQRQRHGERQVPRDLRTASPSSAPRSGWRCSPRRRSASRSGACCPTPSRARSSCSRLVLCASMMPVEKLPLASWQTALGLGFVSAVFDNIPLTALALKQGGYDWGFLAYAVGFGGSMIWFGSSAGVALSNLFPEAKSVGRWLRHGWFIADRLCRRLLRDAGGGGLGGPRAAQGCADAGLRPGCIDDGRNARCGAVIDFGQQVASTRGRGLRSKASMGRMKPC